MVDAMMMVVLVISITCKNADGHDSRGYIHAYANDFCFVWLWRHKNHLRIVTFTLDFYIKKLSLLIITIFDAEN